jgi:superfamily I DNA/RNA helicase
VQAELSPAPKPPLYSKKSDDELLSYGVPAEWLEDVKQATEDSLLHLADRLPAEAAEALLELATGGKPRVAMAATPVVDPFQHPDAKRRFRVMTNIEELKQALDFPWEKWTVFLHPEQRQWVDRDYSGPARVSGSAGTGKTIVALHRAAHLARAHTDARVLLATFTDALAHALQTKLKRLLIASEPRLGERIDVHSLDSLALRLHKAQIGSVKLADQNQIREAIKVAASTVKDHKFSMRFLLTEWDQVVDAWQLDSWEAYRDVARLGRKTRLPETQRNVLWTIFHAVKQNLASQGLKTLSEVYTALAEAQLSGKNLPYDFAVVDEAQDLSVSQLRFFAALGAYRPNALFFAGDIGQRIFQQPFSWKSLGVDIRGRSRNLRVNYRTSHQIRQQADRLLGPEVTDVDGNREDRSDTISVFNGPSPSIQIFNDEIEEQDGVAIWLTEQSNAGILPHEFGLFVRSEKQLDRAQAAVNKTGLPFKILDKHIETASGHVSISTMHLAKGLEFRAVVVMACDDEIVPLQERIETVGDDSDLQEVYETERHLLYVACTRARDHLLVTSASPASEFLDDLRQA